jgi:hypothetical protein
VDKQILIESKLKENGIIHSGRIAEDIFDDKHFYVFIDVQRNSENLQVPSNKKLNDIKNEIALLGVNAEFILTDATKRSIEDGLRASMLHSFPEAIRNSFLTISGTKAQVWLVPKVAVTDDLIKDINQKIGIYLNVFDIEDFSVELTSAANLPSKIVCLTVIRNRSPANLADIVAILRGRHFTVPSEDWMSRMLDVLRRNGMIIRSKRGLYSLSLAGLKALGTSKGRRSPDIERILALARSGE